MKILVHDFEGWPFQGQLSRELASRGHAVIHVYGGRAGVEEMVRLAEGVPALRLWRAECGGDEAGGGLMAGRKLGLAYGRRVAAVVAAERPDVVVSSNTPAEARDVIARACRASGALHYYWLQDMGSLAADRMWRRRVPLAGYLAGAYCRWLEGSQLRAAAGVVAGADDCTRILRREFGVHRDRITIIPNWVPLESVPVRPKRNAWSESRGIADKFVFLHAGPLDESQSPGLLLELARRHRGNDGVRVVVVSEGSGADWLRAQAEAEPLPGLILPHCGAGAAMPDVLASGDVLIGLQADADTTPAIPQSILSYLCAERPVLLAAPSCSPATQLVARERVGMTCAPGDLAAFLEAADHLRGQPGLGPAMGRRGRAYAEKAFRIESIADRFERVIGVSSREKPFAERGVSATGTQVLAA